MAEITLLDGGMGQELIRRSGQKPTPLWSTQILIDSPQIVADVHSAYADAGATVATTNTYAIHRDRLRPESNHYASEGQQIAELEDQFEELYASALNQTDTVRDRGRVAGSVGPLGASYRADLHPKSDTAVSLFSEVVGLLAPRVDIILFETVPSVAAARDAIVAGRTSDRPVWLALTVNDADGSQLRSGEALAEAVDVIADADAALINCSIPEAIPPALNTIAQAGVPFGAYANGFTKIEDDFIEGNTTVSSLSARQDLTPAVYAKHAMTWIEQGATLIGGCCEVGPAHIREMADQIKAAGHTII